MFLICVICADLVNYDNFILYIHYARTGNLFEFRVGHEMQ